MSVSGGGAFALGKLFDRFGFWILVPLTLVSAAFAPLMFLGGFAAALIGAAVWGLGTGVHEAIIPAALAPMVARRRRGSAFGLFTAIYGLAWFAGSTAIGALYDSGPALAAVFCVVTQLLAVPFFIAIGRRGVAPAR